MPTKIPWTAMALKLCLILHSWWLRFLSQWASACIPDSEKSFLAKLSNETSFNMDSILTCTHLLVNQKAPCSRSTTCRGIQLRDTLTLVTKIKQMLRRYGQPSEFSEFTTVKQWKRQQNPSLRWRRNIRKDFLFLSAISHLRNKCFQRLWLQQPISVAAKIWPQWAQACDTLDQAQF